MKKRIAYISLYFFTVLLIFILQKCHYLCFIMALLKKDSALLIFCT